MGRFLVDVYRSACIPYINRLCDISFVHAGMLRNKLDKNITTYDIMNTFPFQNIIIILYIRGQRIYDALTRSVSYMYNPLSNSGFLHSNMLLAINPIAIEETYQQRLVDVQFPPHNNVPTHLKTHLPNIIKYFKENVTVEYNSITDTNINSTKILLQNITGNILEFNDTNNDIKQPLIKTSSYWVSLPLFLFMGGDNYEEFKNAKNILYTEYDTLRIMQFLS